MVELTRERAASEARVGDVGAAVRRRRVRLRGRELDALPRDRRRPRAGELARVLRPGGRLVAVTNGAAPHAEVWRLARRTRSAERRFSRRTARSAAAATFARVERARRRRLGRLPRRRARCTSTSTSTVFTPRAAAPARDRRAVPRRAPAPVVFVAERVIRPAELIERKRDGGSSPPRRSTSSMLGYARGEVPDYQLAALLHGRVLPGPPSAETSAMTDAMIAAATPSTSRPRSAARSSTSTRPAGSATRPRSPSAPSSPRAASRSGR